MGYVLQLELSTRGGGSTLYSLTEQGKQIREGKPLPDLDMTTFWVTMGPTINDIVEAKVEGWDQLRIQYDRTCMPIHKFEVVSIDGRKRSFGIYGIPEKEAPLEKGAGTLPQMYVSLFTFCVGDKYN